MAVIKKLLLAMTKNIWKHISTEKKIKKERIYKHNKSLKKKNQLEKKCENE